MCARDHVVVGRIKAEDGSVRKVTPGSHEFEPSDEAGKLRMKSKEVVDEAERASGISTEGTLVKVAAVLVVRKTFRERRI